MNYHSCFGKIVSFILCIFLVDESYTHRHHHQRPEDCSAGTRCMEASRCRQSVLIHLNRPPQGCGFMYNGKKRICCPTRKPPSGRRYNPGSPGITPGKLQDCGKVNGLQGLVMGGKPAKQGAWPWMVEIAMRTRDGAYVHTCTAALITKRHVLSAAHCFRRTSPSLYKTRIGHVDLQRAHMYEISRIAIPDSYSRRLPFYDDIAVLTLSREVSTSGVSPICLPESFRHENLTGKGTTVAGWGSATLGGGPSNVLMELPDMPIISNSRCQAMFRSKLLSFRSDFPRGISDGIMCAGFLNGEKDTCGGDSGGPLMYHLKDHWFVVGVVSFGLEGNGCAKSDLPGGYTRVSKYLDWILDKIKS